MPSLRRWADRRAVYKERFPMNNVDLVNVFTYEEQGATRVQSWLAQTV